MQRQSIFDQNHSYIKKAAEYGTLKEITYTQHVQIIEAGEKAIVSMYNGWKHDSLDKLGCQQFKEKIVERSKQIQAHVLPSTAGATKYHSIRFFSIT